MRRVLAVMHNNDEITRTTTRDCPACCEKIAQFNFQGDLQSNGPISRLVAASKSHFASVQKKRERPVRANLLTKNFTAFRYALFSDFSKRFSNDPSDERHENRNASPGINFSRIQMQFVLRINPTKLFLYKGNNSQLDKDDGVVRNLLLSRILGSFRCREAK